VVALSLNLWVGHKHCQTCLIVLVDQLIHVEGEVVVDVVSRGIRFKIRLRVGSLKRRKLFFVKTWRRLVPFNELLEISIFENWLKIFVYIIFRSLTRLCLLGSDSLI
jgi:hypothetical protein